MWISAEKTQYNSTSLAAWIIECYFQTLCNTMIRGTPSTFILTSCFIIKTTKWGLMTPMQKSMRKDIYYSWHMNDCAKSQCRLQLGVRGACWLGKTREQKRKKKKRAVEHFGLDSKIIWQVIPFSATHPQTHCDSPACWIPLSGRLRVNVCPCRI